MKLFVRFFCLLFILNFGCQNRNAYSENYYLDSKKVAHGTISFVENNVTYKKEILNKDSIKQFIEDLNNSEYIGICNDGKVRGVIALVVQDTGMIRLEIIDDKIRIPIFNKCYKLNQKYINASR